MSLSIQDCAAQFDLYKEATDTARERSLDHDDRAYHQGKGHAYWHAATFLRENAQLKWTTSTPTKEGLYWLQISRVRGGRQFVAEIKRNQQGILMCTTMGQDYDEPLADYDSSVRWAGPLPVAPLVEETSP